MVDRGQFSYLNFSFDNVEEALQNVVVDDVQNTNENISIQVGIQR